ncbi:aminotransferase class I/II-fold pyridoxal phosphate-dependent enzyme [Robiginitalea marina]|uniref:Aminotransferase class I/II-fold pyridoxal phosphate-dependent enzyme n=1 Tax=Robiginitalea marina TaxID=2954105 RepID=A0ABT1AZM5_9FLAO|nr:aminotransferase class I/II-fold pyridoxal phosphate-dependent enzyme [Robiginitalea marina]MCO5725379.1 aminotransferase class I/II-fold pyridoxal phosphate-dependent enzyme [Robiginitalea marina]
MTLQTEGIPGPEVRADGETYLYFGGTAYLGMQTGPQFLDLLAAHTRRLGAHWGASRMGNLTLGVYREAEARLAFWMQSPACLSLSSGFLAARLVAEYLHTQGHECHFSPNCHAALLLPGHSRQATWDHLKEAVGRSLARTPKKTPVVLADTMGDGIAPGPAWELLATLPREVILVADDSHGLGICGPGGTGSYQPLNALGFRELLLCGSLGKAMGITAGVIAGPQPRIDALKQTPLFAGASPAPPAGLATLAEGLERGWYHEKFLQVSSLAAALQGQLAPSLPLQWRQGYPVLSFRSPALARHLRENSILITDFQYAAEGGTSSPSRIVITAAHKEPHLQQLKKVLGAFRGRE